MTHQDVNTKTRAHAFFPLWVRQKELRQRLPLGHSDALYKSLYSSISRCHSWDGGETARSEQDGFFSLEFSPDGTHLLAGSTNSFLIFDPLSHRLIRSVQDVHTNYVSHVKFLDSRIFATGGDEGKVFLWDTRNLKSRFRALTGHSSSIANIEFSQNNGLIITSAVDGIIYIWDMKNWDQREECKNNTFMSDFLLRLRLNHDETKMIISTARGYLLIVHELDLKTLAHDLDELGGGIPEFAHMNHTIFAPSQTWSRFLSSNRRRNRVEMVADFPNAGGFNVISTLEMHPQGWSVISRRKSEASEKEWTCVHDIQEKEPCAGWVQDELGNEGLPRSNPSVGQLNRRVHLHFPRLSHYIQEQYLSDLYIESLGVSPDGRLLCSPLQRGIRLLAFSPECLEHSVYWNETQPRLLHELNIHTSHSDYVLCTKFSPRHCFLVLGCLEDKLHWFQPVV